MDTQQQIFGLMAVAEEHQKAIKTAIDGLAAERAAIAKERIALTQATESVSYVTGHVKQATIDVVPALQLAIENAVKVAVNTSLSDISKTAVKSLEVTSEPFVGRLDNLFAEMVETAETVKDASQWLAWKWVAVAAGGMVGAYLLAWASILWQRHQIDSLIEQKTELQSEVTELQSNVATLMKKGGGIKLLQCGPRNRLCIEITPNQGSAEGQTNFHGSWQSQDRERHFVIPKGY